MSSRLPAGGRGWASRSRRSRSRCAAIRSRAGLECTPFLVTGASGQDVSVFDNGLPLERHRLDHRDGASRAPAVPPGRRRASRRRAGCAREQPHPGSCPERRAPSRTSSRAPSGGCLLTCLWYIREVDPETLLLTGLTRDGVYLVEHGEIVGSVNNFRFNESPVDVLAKTIEAGRTRTGALAGVERVAQPDGDAAVAGRRVQHELGEPGDLTSSAGPSSAANSPSSASHPACTRSRHDSNSASSPYQGSADLRAGRPAARPVG